jgi:hypothetical protein
MASLPGLEKAFEGEKGKGRAKVTTPIAKEIAK